MHLQKTPVIPTTNSVTPSGRTWIRVNLDALRHNIHLIRNRIASQSSLMAVVKANAYGHGMVPVARAALHAGAKSLAVSHVSEGVALREQGITAPILLLGSCPETDYGVGIQAGLAFAISSVAEARALAAQAADATTYGQLASRIHVHLLIDTGMGRSGVSPEEAAALATTIQNEATLDLEGVFTHFSSAEDPDQSSCTSQLFTLRRVLNDLERQGIRPRIRHAANSAATVFFPQAHLDMVRCGAMLHGMRWWSAEQEKNAGMNDLDLKPALSWHTRIVHLARRPAGATVGYGSTFRANRETILATLPIGYRDGFPRSLSNRGEVLIRGCRAPVCGIVSMDYTVVDITDLVNAGVSPELGEEATLLGADASGQSRITVEEFATRAQTIPYVVTTSLPADAPRIYTGDIVSELAGISEGS